MVFTILYRRRLLCKGSSVTDSTEVAPGLSNPGTGVGHQIIIHGGPSSIAGDQPIRESPDDSSGLQGPYGLHSSNELGDDIPEPNEGRRDEKEPMSPVSSDCGYDSEERREIANIGEVINDALDPGREWKPPPYERAVGMSRRTPD